MVLFYLILGCVFWFATAFATYKGFATPTEAMFISFFLSIPFLFCRTIRYWPFGKVAFAGWGTLSALVGIVLSQSDFVLKLFGNTNAGFANFILQNYGPVLVGIVTLTWIFTVRRLSAQPISLWLLVFFSPAFLMLLFDLMFRYRLAMSASVG